MRASSVDQIILGVLDHQHSHLTSLEIYEFARQQLPAVNPSTVYRSLTRLAGQGKVSVSDMGTGAEVFELTGQERHHHLVCQNCKTIITIRDTDVSKFFSQLEEKYQFEIATNHLVLFGKCTACREAEAQAASSPPAVLET